MIGLLVADLDMDLEEHLTAPLRNTEEENKKKVVLPTKHVTTMTERKVQKTLEDAERNLLQQKLALYKELTESKKTRKSIAKVL